MQDEKSALEYDLGMVSRDLGIAQDDVVSGSRPTVNGRCVWRR